MAQAVASLEQQADKTALITGSEAIAVACKLADVDVITAYPIRPYDTVMQYVAKLVANGELDCEYIVAESEHSQFEIAKHARSHRRGVFHDLKLGVFAFRDDVFAIQQRRGLDVRLRGADRDPGLAYPHGGHGRQPGPG